MAIIKSDSFKNITKVSIGTLIGQIISIISLPFITRLYGVEVIGVWTIINSYSSIMTNIIDLGLTSSLMICDEQSLKKHYSVISQGSLILSGFFGIIFSIYLKENQTNNIFYIILFTIIYSLELVQINLLSMVLNREKKYGVLMYNTAVRFGSVAIIAIVLGGVGLKQNGYIIANIMGQLMTIIHMLINTHFLFVKVDINDFKYVLKKNISFIKFQMPNALTVTLRTELPNILIGELFGKEMLGFFSVSQKLLTIPITFLGQSIGKVFYQRVSEMKRLGMNVGAFVKKSIESGMIISLIPMTLFAALGDVIIVLYFGSSYAIGGILCRMIAFRAFFNFISTAVQGIEIIVDRQNYVLITCVSQTILSVLSILTGFYVFESIYISVFFMVVGFILTQIIYFCKLYKVLQLDCISYIKRIIILLTLMVLLMFIIRNISIVLLKQMNVPIEVLSYFQNAYD